MLLLSNDVLRLASSQRRPNGQSLDRNSAALLELHTNSLKMNQSYTHSEVSILEFITTYLGYQCLKISIYEPYISIFIENISLNFKNIALKDAAHFRALSL